MKTSVASFRHLRRLKLRLKADDSVQIQRAGGFYKARFKGAANFVFGATAPEARERLLKAPTLSVTNHQRNEVMREKNWAVGFRKGKTA